LFPGLRYYLRHYSSAASNQRFDAFFRELALSSYRPSCSEGNPRADSRLSKKYAPPARRTTSSAKISKIFINGEHGRSHAGGCGYNQHVRNKGIAKDHFRAPRNGKNGWCEISTKDSQVPPQKLDDRRASVSSTRNASQNMPRMPKRCAPPPPIDF